MNQNRADSYSSGIMVSAKHRLTVDYRPTYFQPGVGWQGKGLLFSRWNTQDILNADVQPDGFTECGQHEDLFIGVRNRWRWTLGRYTCSASAEQADDAIGRCLNFMSDVNLTTKNPRRAPCDFQMSMANRR